MHLHDPLTYPQLVAYYDAIAEVQSMRGKNGKEEPPEIKLRQILLPSLIGCVEKWDLENFPKKVSPENFPASPTADSGAIVGWLQGEIVDLIKGESEVPNES